MIYIGMEPWPEGEPVIELRVGEELVDLHNWASFEGFEYRPSGSLLAKFDYDPSEGRPSGATGSARVQLRFGGVSDLRVWHDERAPAYESDSLRDFTIRHVAVGRASVQMTLMDGLSVGFQAGSVVFEKVE